MESSAGISGKEIMKRGFGRISALLWADILVAYALFVMQNYLTDVWKLSFTHAAGILNVWGGIYLVLPSFFLFLKDGILGNFGVLLISSMAYSVGIGFIAMSTPPVLANSTGTCKQYEPQCIGHTQKALFYTGMALVAVGMAGNQVSLMPMLGEQQEHDNNYSIKDCLKIPGYIFVAVVPVIGAIALPYIKPWSIRFGIPAICTVIAMFIFLSGWKDYVKDPPQGSPLVNVCRVFVASASKRSRSFPLDANQFYKNDNEELKSFPRTRFLRCLEKAAIILPHASQEEQENNRWRLCSVAEVEEAKIAVRMVPMWMTFIICGIVSSIGNTYFVEQANNMNRKIGKWKVPLQAFLLLFNYEKQIFSSLATRFLKRSEKYAPPIGIAVAMVFSVLCCIVAALVETRRLKVIRRHGLLDKPDEDIPMSVYWLLFQFFLLAGLDSFFQKSVAEFYNYQAPESMRSHLGYFTKGVFGLGFMCSVLSVYVVGKVSEKGGKPNWFRYTLNGSRLDRYYWVLAGLSAVNLLVYSVVAFSYRYKNREAQDGEGVDAGNTDLPTDGNDDGQCFPCCG